MENFIYKIVEGFDFGALSAMDDQPSEIANVLSSHMLKDQLLPKICENLKATTRDQYVITDDYAECNPPKFNAFTPKYCICDTYGNYGRKSMVVGFTIDGNGSVDIIINGNMDQFTNYINCIYKELEPYGIKTNNLYITRTRDMSVSKILVLNGIGLDVAFKDLNFDNLPSHIYVVNQSGEAKSEFVCVYNLSSTATVNDVVSFESYIDSLDQDIAVQYEYASGSDKTVLKEVINYVEGTVYMKNVNNPDEILKKNGIKMTQKDCDRVSDLIKQNKDASAQANKIGQLSKAVSRFAWYCKLSHINPAIFKGIYKNENKSFFYTNIGTNASNRLTAFDNCKAFYNTALGLGLTEEIMYAAYAKTFAEENADNTNRQLTSANYGALTPFMLFIDNLRVPYTIDSKSIGSYYYNYSYYGSNGYEDVITLTLLDNNTFTVRHRSRSITVSFDHDCDFTEWIKANITDHYGFQNLKPKTQIECSLQKLRTYILRFLKYKKTGK